ncbi:MAG: response regulator transcription factor [Pirellulales bacterium]
MIADSKPTVSVDNKAVVLEAARADLVTDSKPTIFVGDEQTEPEALRADLVADSTPTASMRDESDEQLEPDEPDETDETDAIGADLVAESKPTVFVVDDDADLRRVLTVLIKAMHLDVRDFASAAEFLNAFDPAQSGCLLVDVRMPGMSGIELLDVLASRSVSLPVIMISGHGDVPMAVRVMKAGAVAFLEKPFRDHELWESIQQAIRLDTERRRDFGWRNEVKERIGNLTPMEREVMDLIVTGESNKSMALRLGVSVRTVEVRRAKVMRKMRAATMADLIRWALIVDADGGKASVRCAKPRSACLPPLPE